MIYAATGHRPNKLGGEYLLDGPISKKILDKMRSFLSDATPKEIVSGMAQGVDQLWAMAGIEFGIPVIAAVPFSGQESVWPYKSRVLYYNILKQCSEIVVISDGGFSASKMQRRNEWMVDRCNKLFAVWDGSNGGTCNCVKYAERVGKDIHRVNLSEVI